jgi:hypothetical protein
MGYGDSKEKNSILVSGCVQNISWGLFILFPARPRGGFRSGDWENHSTKF